MTAAVDSASTNAPVSDRRRSTARLAAVQALYEMDMVGADADSVLAAFLEERWSHGVAEGTGAEAESAPGPPAPLVEPDREWLGDLVRGAAAERSELDDRIDGALASGLSSARLESLIRVILRAGAYELARKPRVPAAVVVNEYVEVAHAFLDGKECGLVNAVLDRLARDLRAGEF